MIALMGPNSRNWNAENIVQFLSIAGSNVVKLEYNEDLFLNVQAIKLLK